MACSLHVDVRQWKHVRKELVAAGKITVGPQGISNDRAEEVLAERRARRNERASAIKKAGDDNRPTPATTTTSTPASTSPGIAAGTAGTTPRGTDADLSKNTNENNEALRKKGTYAHAEPESQSPDAESESITKPALLENAAARSGLAGLNGSAEPMLKDVAQWMVGGDDRSARNWLGKHVEIFGQDAVRKSYSKLITDIATGQMIRKPLQTWSRIAERIRAEPQKSSSNRRNDLRAAQRVESQRLNDDLRREHGLPARGCA